MKMVNMHEAKTRLSELVKAVEENNEVIILCRNGKPVAEIKSRRAIRPPIRVNPKQRVKFSPGFDPVAPATEDDWPETAR
jgi:prevent-host-death family protein